MSARNTLAVGGFIALVVACGGGAGDVTTTTAPPTTTVAPTTTSSPATPTTVSSPTTAVDAATGDLSLLHAAMASTTDSAPTRIEGTIRMSGLPAEAGVDEVEMPFSVATDPATGDSSFVMDFGAMFTAMGEIEDMPAELAEMMGSMEFRQIGDVTYFKFPFFTAFMGAETEWVSMPTEEGGGIADDLGPGTTPSDPGGMLESLSDAEGSVEVLGPEEIRGIATTHYRLVLDDTWHEGLSDEELADLEEQGFVTGSFPLDLWVGDDGLVHRMSVQIQASEMDGGSGEDFESMTMTFDFFDFGQSITIEPPPPDEVTDIEDLAGGLGIPAP